MGAPLCSYEKCLDDCGLLDSMGVGIDHEQLVNFAQHETTPDQSRIEDELEKMDRSHQRWLHVGVGNSGLAQRFASQVERLDGVTVSPEEKQRAESLQIDNYRVFLLSKYSTTFQRTLSMEYDVIIDNNLNGFACCQKHFKLMLNHYLDMLTPRGKIITDQRGMEWAFADPNWKLTYDDLLQMQKRFPMKVSQLTAKVYALEAM